MRETIMNRILEMTKALNISGDWLENMDTLLLLKYIAPNF
jgi:hypothetical protein